MHKLIEYCPNCASMRELDQSLGMLTGNSDEQKIVYQYHCASCNSYLGSTTLDYQEVTSPNEYAVISIPVYA